MRYKKTASNRRNVTSNEKVWAYYTLVRGTFLAMEKQGSTMRIARNVTGEAQEGIKECTCIFWSLPTR